MPSTALPQDHLSPKRSTSKRKDRPPQVIPSPEPADSRYAPDVWGSGGLGSLEELTVPSGQLCLVRRPGVQGLMAAGVLHQADSLTALVHEKHLKKRPRPGSDGGIDAQQIDVSSLAGDPEALGNLLHVVDRVICHVVVKPEVHMTPGDVTRRKSGVIYANMVDLEDKMFLFNYAVGGTRDLESFRNELQGSLGSLDVGEDVPDSALPSVSDQR